MTGRARRRPFGLASVRAAFGVDASSALRPWRALSAHDAASATTLERGVVRAVAHKIRSPIKSAGRGSRQSRSLHHGDRSPINSRLVGPSASISVATTDDAPRITAATAGTQHPPLTLDGLVLDIHHAVFGNQNRPMQRARTSLIRRGNRRRPRRPRGRGPRSRLSVPCAATAALYSPTIPALSPPPRHGAMDPSSADVDEAWQSLAKAHAVPSLLGEDAVGRRPTLPRQRTRPAGVHRAQLTSAFVSNRPTFATPRSARVVSFNVAGLCGPRAHWSTALRVSSSVLPLNELRRCGSPSLRLLRRLGAAQPA